MNENGKRRQESNKTVNCASESVKTIVNKSSLKFYQNYLRKFPRSKILKRWLCAKKNKDSANQKLNEHDMLQANQANLKCSTSYASNVKQVININSSFHERYHKLQKLSLHHILSKGNWIWGRIITEIAKRRWWLLSFFLWLRGQISNNEGKCDSDDAWFLLLGT